MTEDSPFLFVYGTLRSGAGHPMHDLLMQHASRLGSASTPGQLFDTGRYPAAVAANNPHDLIHGELFEIDRPDEVWTWLDEYEGYFAGDEGDSLFVRRLSLVTLSDGQSRHAWMYWYNRPVDDFERIESGRYE